MTRLSPIALLLPALLGALTLAGGCAGTTVVDYAISAQVRLIDQAGNVRDVSQDAVRAIPRTADATTPFPSMQYRGESLEWTFGTGTLGLGGGVTNRGASAVCMRFDEAVIASNMHPTSIPLRVSNWAALDGDKWSRIGSTRPQDRHQVFAPPPLCLDPGKRSSSMVAPDLRELFPTQKMFNVRGLESETSLVDRGIGNWVRMSVPLCRTASEPPLRSP